MSRERRREMVDREHPALTLRQCALGYQSSVYYRPREKDLTMTDRPAVPGHVFQRKLVAHEGLAGQARPPGKLRRGSNV